MAKRLILVGAGGFGRELLNWIGDAASMGKGLSISGFLDNSPYALEAFSYAIPWLGTPADYRPDDDDVFVLAIGDPEGKRNVSGTLKSKGANFITFIHPSAVVARTAVLGEGVVVCPLAVISTDAVIGEFVSINCLSSVGHDVRIGAYSTLSAHVDLTGFVEVGELSFFGTGAKVVPKVKIGNCAKIGAGALVVRTVRDGQTIYAPPSKRL